MATLGRKYANRDRKNIFKHYAKMGEGELKSQESHLKKHISDYSKQGIHTTPEHMQSVKYHLKDAKAKALKARTNDKVGSRKKDFTSGGKQGNWHKVHKLDHIG